jgi:hypothetical protein
MPQPSKKLEDVEDYKRLAIQQYDAISDRDVLAARRRGRQTTYEISRARSDLVPQAGGKRASHTELSFQPGRQTVLLGKPRREVAPILAIPRCHLIMVVAGVMMLTPVFVLLFVVTTAVSLGQRHAIAECHQCRHNRTHPYY